MWISSAGPEHFLALRRNFMTSHATACIANWVLGIGDRHLSNTLVSLKSGRTVEVDFSHAFGTATQLQQIPELVPFRLTPHIISISRPLDEQGPIRKNMERALNALRNNSQTLLATMSVFIFEPSLEWAETGWNPYQKLSLAKSKLEGVSSAAIMIEELQARNGDNPELIAKYVDHIKVSVTNCDARKKHPLNVDMQVKSLIEHATDYNLLGRMYCGWEAWV